MTGGGVVAEPGAGVDSKGQPVLDPTKNVLDLVEAAIKRQDDLRQMEALHQREIGDLRHEYEAELRKAETARIDAIRAVDVGAVNRAAEVSATQAATLASQVATSAETLRAQVAAAAQAATTALAAALEPIQKDIADLRKTQYEQAGQKAQTIESGTGSRAWIGLAIAGVAALSAFFLGVTGIVITLVLSR